MRSENDTKAGARQERTFIETARRAQIVAAAIDTIAEIGYGQASLARIAERIGVSKGVICYHFSGKDDLMQEVVAEAAARAVAYMGPRISAESGGGAAMLRAYIESNLAFMREYRNHLIAVVEITRSARDADGGPVVDTTALRAGTGVLAQMLASFQAAGQLRAGFDPLVMAVAIRGAIDAVAPRLAAEPGLDLDHYGRELAEAFDRATRSE